MTQQICGRVATNNTVSLTLFLSAMSLILRHCLGGDLVDCGEFTDSLCICCDGDQVGVC